MRSIINLITDSSAISTFDTDDYHRLAQKLSSLVTGTQNLNTPLIALHTSFTDFLASEARSQQKYSIDPDLFNERLASGCLRLMLATLRFNICKIPTSSKSNKEIENIKGLIRHHIPNSLSYACQFWAYHISKVSAWTELKALRESVTALLSDRVLQWLEVMSLTETLPLDSLGCLENTYKVRNSHFLPLGLLVLTPLSRSHPIIPTFPTLFAKHPNSQHFLPCQL